MPFVVYNYKSNYVGVEDLEKSTDEVVHFKPGRVNVTPEVLKKLCSFAKPQIKAKGFAKIPATPELVIQEKGVEHEYESLVVRPKNRRVIINWVPIDRDGTEKGLRYDSNTDECIVSLGWIQGSVCWSADLARWTRTTQAWKPSEQTLEKDGFQAFMSRLKKGETTAEGKFEIGARACIEGEVDSYYMASKIKLICQKTRRVLIDWEPTDKDERELEKMRRREEEELRAQESQLD